MRRKKRMRRRRAEIGAEMARGACLAATVLALLMLGHEIGSGAAAVYRGEITAAEMLTNFGEWMRGAG